MLMVMMPPMRMVVLAMSANHAPVLVVLVVVVMLVDRQRRGRTRPEEAHIFRARLHRRGRAPAAHMPLRHSTVSVSAITTCRSWLIIKIPARVVSRISRTSS